MKSKITVIAMLASLFVGVGMAGTAGAVTVGGTARDAAASQPAPTVQQAQFWDHNRGRGERREWRDRGDRREWRERRGGRDWRPRHERRHYHRPPPPRGGAYYHYGPSYRYAPPRYAPPRQAYRLPASHVRWCQNRYRSYRAWDNTFQPYNGPRRQCTSPYV